MELKVLKLNLQQTIIYEDVPSNCIAICAIHDKHKSLLVMHTDYSSLTNKVEDFLKTTDLKYARIIWGDGFHCDTWGGGIFHLDIDAEGIPTVGTYTEDNLNREGPTDAEIEEFKRYWGQTDNEIRANLELEEENLDYELLMDDYFWIPNDEIWCNKHASTFTARDQEIADFLIKSLSRID